MFSKDISNFLVLTFPFFKVNDNNHYTLIRMRFKLNINVFQRTYDLKTITIQQASLEKEMGRGIDEIKNAES